MAQNLRGGSAPAPSPSAAPAPTAAPTSSSNALYSAGSALPPPLRHQLETRFGTDLSGVTVHESHAPTLRGVQSFTAGNQIHFAPGIFNPNTPAGSEMIGHEIAHIVQQRRPGVHGMPLGADPTLEQEADAIGRRAMAGVPVSPQPPE